MNGVLNLFKPPGMTSQQAVSRVRRTLSEKKAGHSGTLDPGACGVLPVCIGRATKLASYVSDGEKEYIAELTLGAATDTLDADGKITAEKTPHADARDVESALSQFRGEIWQTPPAYSAVKVAGRRLYSYARQGREVQAAARRISVPVFEMLSGTGTGPFLFRIVCSKGTYVRSLLADAAASVGECGHTSFLLRTRVGAFHLADAYTFEDLEAGRAKIMTPAEAAPGERIDIPAHLYDILLHGGAPILPESVPEADLAEGVLYAVFCAGEFFGLGLLEDQRLKLKARIRI